MGTLYMMASPNMAFPDVKLSDKRIACCAFKRGIRWFSYHTTLWVIKIYLRLEKMF